MRLDYNVLWVEDDENWRQSVEDIVRDEVEQDGFDLVITTATGVATMPGDQQLRDFDLILMDLNLDEGGSGGQLIQRLRQHEVYTDVVFYSAMGTTKVRDTVRQLGLDGVFCVDRGEEFRERIPRIIRMTVRKVQNLNGLRGVVVAVAGELDHLLRDLVDHHDTALGANQQQTFRKKAWRVLRESLRSDLKKAEKALSGGNLELPDARLLDATKCWRLAVGIAEALGDKVPPELLAQLKALDADVLKPRNLLAHEKAVWIDKKLVIRSRRDPSVLLEFDDERCRTTRQTLRTHRRNLEALLELLRAIRNAADQA